MHGNELKMNETYLQMMYYLLWKPKWSNNEGIVMMQTVCKNALKKLDGEQGVCENAYMNCGYELCNVVDVYTI